MLEGEALSVQKGLLAPQWQLEGILKGVSPLIGESSPQARQGRKPLSLRILPSFAVSVIQNVLQNNCIFSILRRLSLKSAENE